MENMREIKLRIKSITQTKQITKAMKLISASKLKKARQQLASTLPYFKKVELTMIDILSHSVNIHNIYIDSRTEKQDKVTGILVLTGDKGLAGGYNHNIIRMAEDMYNDAAHPMLFIAGQIGREYFIRKDFLVERSFDYPVSGLSVRRAKEIAGIMLERFEKGELDEIYLVYTEMVSSLKLVPQAIRLLPLNLDTLRGYLGIDGTNLPEPDDSIYYEPSVHAVFNVLIQKYLKGIIYGTLVEAYTSEQSARMTAMDSATTNADKMIQSLSLRYNRARQSAITQEISEIVGGASAL